MNEKIATFLNQPSSLPKLVVIYGPTASGKTSMSIDIAKHIDSQVISADSRQIYRMMDIGTAKVTSDEMQGIPHHLIDIRDPHESYSVGEWVRDAQEIITGLHEKGKIPIVCGGTGLYIDALIHQFDIPEIPADEVLRSELEGFRQKQGNEALWQKLADIDPDYAADLHPNNYHYVIRGIEVFTHSGVSKKDLKTKKDAKYDALLLCPWEGTREELYGRIDARALVMIEDGLVDEVKAVLQNYKYQIPNTKFEDESFGTWYSKFGTILKEISGLNSIGYKEVLEHLAGEYDLDRCVELIQQHSRNYAKRQMTWFRRYSEQLPVSSKQ